MNLVIQHEYYREFGIPSLGRDVEADARWRNKKKKRYMNGWARLSGAFVPPALDQAQIVGGLTLRRRCEPASCWLTNRGGTL